MKHHASDRQDLGNGLRIAPSYDCELRLLQIVRKALPDLKCEEDQQDSLS